MRKLVGLFAGAAILVAACGGTSATQPRPSVAAPSAPRRARRAPAGDRTVRIGRHAVRSICSAPRTRRKQAPPGGTIIIGDWQEATQFNPYYLGQVTEANVASLVWHSLLTITDDFKYVPAARGRADPDHRERRRHGPGENGDAMTVTWKLRDGLKWSDGEPLTCDDFKYA